MTNQELIVTPQEFEIISSWPDTQQYSADYDHVCKIYGVVVKTDHLAWRVYALYKLAGRLHKSTGVQKTTDENFEILIKQAKIDLEYSQCAHGKTNTNEMF